ncbi:MAG: type II secretion system protein [Candidatus Vogelbacteria bacterium]|nr:type II secretion system protein [Candidatus Vogelbacteria bacterium]
MKKHGFTLIELLVVIAIIALLSSIIFASLSKSRVKAENAKRNQYIVQYRNALELYASSNKNLYPWESAITNNKCFCLGNYAGFGYSTPTYAKCGKSPDTTTGGTALSVCEAVLNTNQPFLKNALSSPTNPIIANFPAISTKIFKTRTTPANEYWIGAVYNCTTISPTDASKCRAAQLIWYLDGINQTCAGNPTGADYTNNYGNDGLATRCVMRFGS